MTWFVLAVATAFFASARDIESKRRVRSIDPKVVSWAQSLFAIPFLAIIFACTDFPEIGDQFGISVVGAGSVLAFGWMLYIKAISLTDLSLCIPIAALSPLFLLVLAAVFLGEIPSLMGIIGVLLIVIGTYVLGASKNKSSILAPLQSLFTDRGARLALMAAFLFSIVATFEKLGIKDSSPALFSLSENIVVALCMVPVVVFSKSSRLREVFVHWRQLLPIGFFIAMMFFTQATAMKLGPVAYVVAVKRFSVLLGLFAGCIFFGEGQFRERLMATLIILLGLLIIALA